MGMQVETHDGWQDAGSWLDLAQAAERSGRAVAEVAHAITCGDLQHETGIGGRLLVYSEDLDAWAHGSGAPV